ncbi:hypothetical protein ABE237_22145 [Brevibacillus formosus]
MYADGSNVRRAGKTAIGATRCCEFKAKDYSLPARRVFAVDTLPNEVK